MTSRIRHLVLRPAAALLVVATVGVALASPLDAQIIKVPESAGTGRAVTGSLGIGFLQSQDRFDGQSGTYWALGEAVSYRASVDIEIGAGALGLTGNLASLPLSRSGGTAAPGSRGHIQLRQAMVTFRTKEGEGFFQVVEIGVGAAQWTGYSGNEVLTADERKARNAFAFAIGYGFGYGLGDRASLTLVQDLGNVIGSSSGLPSGASRVVRQYTTRVGLRIRLAGER